MSLSTLGNPRESQSLGRGQTARTPRWPSSLRLEWEGLELLGAEPGGELESQYGRGLSRWERSLGGARVLVWEGLELLGAEPGEASVLVWEGLEPLGAEPGGARVLVWEGLEPLGAEPGGS